MNYKKLKRVFALGMAVLLSVSTSVYGGTMEVRAAEAISDDLLENEVMDNSSLEENTEKKGDVQGDTQGAGQGDSQDNAQDAGQDDGQDNAQNAGQGDSNDNVQNAEHGDVQGDTNGNVQNVEQGDTPNAEQANTQSTEQEKIQVNIQGDTQDAGQDAVVLTEQDEKPAALATTMAAPTKVKDVSYSTLFENVYLCFENSEDDWRKNVNKVSVNGAEYNKADSAYMWEGKLWYADYYNSEPAVIISLDSDATYPSTVVISATGYKDLELKLNRTGSSSYSYVFTAEVISDTTPDTPAAQTYTVTTSDCSNGTLTVAPNTAEAGTEVKVTATPNEEYEVESVTASQENSTAVDLTAGTESGVYTFTMPASNVTVSATFKEAVPAEAGKIVLNQLKLEKEWMGSNWNLKFTNADGYVSKVTAIKVNDKAWEETSYGPYYGGSYKKNTDKNYLIFAGNDNSGSQDKPVLKSGDVITITATGYEDLTFKLVIDPNGNASLTEVDNQGDPYKLHVKIEGSFEAAIVGQKDYDGVSSASTGGASSNKNSAVTVYGALVRKDTDPADSDWKALDHLSKIQLEGSKCSVSIVPDTAGGTAASSDSGMNGRCLYDAEQ